MTEQRKEEINRELHDINEEFFALKKRQKELTDEKNNEIKEKLKVLIGRCFYDDRQKRYFMVTDIPKETFFKAGESFNPYQIPIYAFYTQEKVFHSEVGEFYFDTLFSHCCEADDPLAALVDEEHLEVTWQEFMCRGTDLIKAVIDKTQEDMNE